MVERLYAVLNWLIDPVNLTAISTVVIAAFTIVLAVVGYFQARLIRQSIDLARQDLLLLIVLASLSGSFRVLLTMGRNQNLCGSLSLTSGKRLPLLLQ